MPYLITIFNGYVNSGILLNVLKPKYGYFYSKYNIDLDNEFIPINDYNIRNQINVQDAGGKVFETKIKNIKYSFEYFKLKNPTEYDEQNFTNAVVIKRVDEQINEPNQVDEKYASSKHCALLLYNDTDLLKLAFLNMYADCYKTEEKQKKSGSILLKLIILFAKSKGFKKIVLSDQSQYTCKDNTYNTSYEIKYIHTLTHGKTWYQKYGFNFINQGEIDTFNYNKLILDNLKTKDYPLELLIDIIMYKIVDLKIYKYMDKYDYLLNINNIIKMHKQYYDHPFYHFMKIISREYCFLVTHIYMEIFDSLKLKKYVVSEMELNISPNSDKA